MALASTLVLYHPGAALAAEPLDVASCRDARRAFAFVEDRAVKAIGLSLCALCQIPPLI